MSSRSAWLVKMGAVLALSAGLAFPAEPLRLKQAIEAALARSDQDNSGSLIAAAQLELLRSLDRVKVDLRPQVGMFSFSDPSLIATSAGAGIQVSRRTSPGAAAIQSAQIDVLGSEIAHKRARLQTEIETARHFFEVAAKQENAQRVCASLQDAKRRQTELAKLIKNAKLTAVDQVRYDEQTLEREVECVDAETQRKLAALQLGMLTGFSDQNSEIRVADVDLPLPGPERPIPAVGKLFEIAMDFRPEPGIVRDRIAAVAPKVDGASRLRPDLLSVGYYHVQESSNAFGRSTPNYLLGGNTVRAESTWNVSLRNTGERAAGRDLNGAKVKALEAQLTALREEIRNQLAAIYVMASGSLEKLPATRQRMELLSKGRNLVATRFQNGLGGPTAIFEAEQESVQAQGRLTQANFDLKANTFIMLAIAGIEDKPRAEQDRLLGYSLSSVRQPAPERSTAIAQ